MWRTPFAPRTFELGYILQRLFSIFPDGWPGLGLLLLRSGTSVRLVWLALADLSGRVGLGPMVGETISIAVAILLLLGLWTPVAGAAAATDQLWLAFSAYKVRPDDAGIHVLLAVFSTSIALLGPGAWSIDARLFGRKRFELRSNRGRQSPH